MSVADLKKRKKSSEAISDAAGAAHGKGDDYEKTSKPASKSLKDDLISKSNLTESKSASLWMGALALITFLSFATRFYNIHLPSQVVFDEVHFGKFASYYLRREYFFDVHPPLGKMMLAAAGWFAGYDGSFLFDEIGDDLIKNKVPYVTMRALPALCGSLVPVLVFLILKEVGASVGGAVFGAMLLVLDNALITQSRLILLDAMLLLFGVMCTYTWIKFHKERQRFVPYSFRLFRNDSNNKTYRPFSKDWWFWLASTGVSLGLVLGVKMVGLFMIGSVGICVLVDLWRLLDAKRKVPDRVFVRHFAARALCLIFLPLAVYLSFFYIHFAVLTKSGTGDAYMSPAFQAELDGSDIASKATAIPYGSLIRMKHKETGIFLHSHLARYPLQYEDARISSEGQQVTGYPHEDPNNLWEVIAVDPAHFPPAGIYHPTKQEEERGVRYVRHNEPIRLRHVSTDSFLLTHDVASPLTSTNMEFTTLAASIGINDKYNDTVFKFTVTDASDGEKVYSRRSHLKLVSVPHRVAAHTLKTGLLPEWGFAQQEINGNKNLGDRSNIWWVDEVQHARIVNGTEIDEIQEKKEKSNKPRLTFVQKFVELQSAMISHNAGLTASHPYASSPGIWPFVIRGISFWEIKDELKQIYLLGNPLVWWFTITLTLVYPVLYVLDRLAWRRGYDILGEARRRWWDRSTGFFFIAWALHWLPFFLMGRQLFLHHYLPSFIYSCVVSTLVLEFLFRAAFVDPIALLKGDVKAAETLPMKAWLTTKRSGLVYIAFLVVLTGVFTYSFWYFAPLVYGISFGSVEDVRARKWLTSWDLQHA
ncbi:hypothetical protein HDV05_003669 [Chytridiales sp. JEL 0842]|nr:hypothetical protein HDV05_003669 [Chytridiales sp. JEL 0842]